MAIQRKKSEKKVAEAPPPVEVVEAPVEKSKLEEYADGLGKSLREVREELGIADDGSEDDAVEFTAAEDVVAEATANAEARGGNRPPRPAGMSDEVAEQLVGYVERIKYNREQQAELKKAEKEQLAEAKAKGFDVGVIKAAIKELELTPKEREEKAKEAADRQQLIDLYVLTCEESV